MSGTPVLTKFPFCMKGACALLLHKFLFMKGAHSSGSNNQDDIVYLCIFKSTGQLASELREENKSKKLLPCYAVKLPRRSGVYLPPYFTHFGVVN